MPLMDWGIDCHRFGLAPKFLLVLHTHKGMLAVAAHAIEDLDEATAKTVPHRDLCQVLAEHIVDFHTAVPMAHPNRSIPPRSEQFLRVRSGTKEVLVRASEVQRVGKHTGVQELQPGKTLHWVVQFEDELLSARSLGASYQAACIGTDEPWCLYPARHGCQAVLVQEVLGFVQASAQQVKTLQHDGQSSTWLLRQQEAPLELLPMERLASDAPYANTVAQNAAPSASDLPTLSADAPAWRAQAHGALNLGVGPWNLVLPAIAVRAVLGRAKDLRISTERSAHALPVFDLRCLLEMPGLPLLPTADSTFATQVCLGARQLLLFSEYVASTHDPGSSADTGWHSVPALPQALYALLRAVRLGSGGCELLVQTQNVCGLRNAFARSRMKAAFVGWYAAPAPASNPPNTSNA